MESSIGETVCGDGHAAPRAQPYISFVVPAPISEQSNKFNVQLDDGRVFTVEPPEGCSVGDTVHAVILDDDETGLSTLMLIPHESSKALPVAAASSDTIQFEEIWHEEEGQPQGRKRHTLGIKTISAMAAGAVIGTLVAGPIAGAIVVGVVLTGATIHTTQTYKDFKKTSIGLETTAAAAAATAKIQAIDEKLGVSEAVHNTKEALVSKVKAVDSKYEITDKTTTMKASIEDKVNDASTSVTQKMREKDEEYKVSETLNTMVKSVEEKANRVGDDMKAAGARIGSRADMMWRQVSQRFRTPTSSAESVESPSAPTTDQGNIL